MVDLVGKAKEAIDRVLSDRSVSLETTKERLEELGCDIECMVEGLGWDIENRDSGE